MVWTYMVAAIIIEIVPLILPIHERAGETTLSCEQPKKWSGPNEPSRLFHSQSISILFVSTFASSDRVPGI